MGILDDLLDLFDGEVIVQPGTTDGYGTFTNAGSALTLPARFEGGSRLVRDRSGQEVVSTMTVIVAGLLASSDPSAFRFTLPSTFTPSADIQAIAIEPVSDETGPIYTEVILP